MAIIIAVVFFWIFISATYFECDSLSPYPVPLLIRRTTQRFGRCSEDEPSLGCVSSKNTDFLEVMGRTALKTRNCFAAATEFFNMCLERYSRRSAIWFMVGRWMSEDE
jgi:hypothetical protein